MARAGVLDASWTAPTTNIDGSPLTDLSSFNLYYDVGPTPCPGSTVISVPAPTATPGQDQTVAQRLTGLTPGTQYYAAITAVNAAGVESECSPPRDATARLDPEPTAPSNPEPTGPPNPEPTGPPNPEPTGPPNPQPTVTSLSLWSTFADGSAFIVSVDGTGFVPDSTAQVNGSARETIYVSPTQLFAVILASDVPGATQASFSVVNPTPGGGS